MEVHKIYFDMDGVLADFERGIREICGVEPIPQSEERDAETEDKMWNLVKEAGHFYDMLEIMPGAEELFNTVYGKYGDKCEILSGIPRPRRGIDSAADDKTNWIRRLLSKDIKMNLVFRKDKAGFCHGKGDILIDDYEKNITELNEMGGPGVLYTSSEETLKKLKELGVL